MRHLRITLLLTGLFALAAMNACGGVPGGVVCNGTLSAVLQHNGALVTLSGVQTTVSTAGNFDYTVTINNPCPTPKTYTLQGQVANTGSQAFRDQFTGPGKGAVSEVITIPAGGAASRTYSVMGTNDGENGDVFTGFQIVVGTSVIASLGQVSVW